MLEKFHMDSQFGQRNESGDSLHIDKIGGIDLFLLDQVLKGNIHREMNILEVGCGYGKNLPFFLESKYHISGIDKDPKAIHSTCYRYHLPWVLFNGINLTLTKLLIVLKLLKITSLCVICRQI